MENQPTQPSAAGRLLFRLASMARQQQLGQAPAPAPAAPTTAAAAQPALVAGPGIPLPRPPTEPSPGQPQPPQAPLQSQQTPPTIAANGEPSTRAQPESTQQAAPSPSPAVPSPPPISQTSPPPLPPPSPRSRLPSREPTPPQSPKVIKPSSPIPPESPKVRQLQPVKTPPESPRVRELQPIKAPPPYPEPEPKPPSAPSPRSKFTQQGNGDESAKTISDINEKPVVDGLPSPKKTTAPDETGMATARKKDEYGEMKIITMVGENTGAYMELGRSYRQNVNRKQQPGHQLQYRPTKGSGESESEDWKSDDKKKDEGKRSAGEGKPTAALVNSNVQSINNSILFRSSSIQQSPGVRLTIVSQRPPKHESTTHQ